MQSAHQRGKAQRKDWISDRISEERLYLQETTTCAILKSVTEAGCCFCGTVSKPGRHGLKYVGLLLERQAEREDIPLFLCFSRKQLKDVLSGVTLRDFKCVIQTKSLF